MGGAFLETSTPKRIMKNTLLIVVAGIGLGFAAGWLAKPTPETASRSVEDSARSSSRKMVSASPQSAAKTARRNRVVLGENAADDVDPELQKAIDETQSRQTKMMRKRFSDQFDLKIAAMIKELGLNAGQEQALRDFYAKQLEKIDISNMASIMTDPGKISEIAGAIRGDGLNDYMQAHLSGDQLDGLEAYQERKKKSQVESVALKDLAKLQQTLDLSLEQKDEVYGLLMEDAEKGLEEQSDADFVSRAMMSSYGVEMDLGDMDMGSMMELANPQNAGDLNQASMIQQIKDKRQKQIDAKVERLAPVLNDNQQAQYRKSLESKGGMLNMMIQGIEARSQTSGE